MALFKILRGPSTNLGNQPFKDGYCYFAADTGLFYIDYEENGIQKRIPLNSDGATGIIDQNTGMPLKLWHGSADEYEAIEEKDDNTIYILNDEVTGEVSAEEIGYNNSLSGLKSVNVQDAINEIAAISTTAQNDINTHINNEDIHVSIEEKINWNNKATTNYVDEKITEIPTPDVSGQIETHNNDENSHPYILKQLANKEVLGSAQEVRNELNVHADNTTIHITDEERADWNNKTTEEYVNQQIGEHNVSSDSHNDIRGDISNLNNAFITHIDNKENPHEVTIEQIGAEAEGSAATALEEAKQYTNEKIDAIVGEGAAESLDTIGEISNALKDNADIIDVLNQAIGEKATKVDLTAHINNKENPHSVTKSQVGLGNVDNTSDANKPVSTAQATAIDNVKKTAMSYVDEKFNSIPDWAKAANKPTYTANEVGAIDKSQKGTVGGVASLDDTGNVPYSQLGNVSNSNLLHNWHLADPVDQRGGYVVPPGLTAYSDPELTTAFASQTTTYYKVTELTDTYAKFTFTSGSVGYVPAADVVRGYVGLGYTIDRWRIVRQNSSLLVTEQGVQTIPGQEALLFNQKIKGPFDKWKNKTLTLSLLRSDNKLFTCTGTLPDVEPASNTDYASTPRSDDMRLYIQWVASDHTLNANLNKYITESPNVTYIAAKLELGSTQTLAHQDENGNWVLNDPPPDKATELLKCCMSTADPSDTYANNKMTPAAVNAVNKAGDTMTGNLVIHQINDAGVVVHNSGTDRYMDLINNANGHTILTNTHPSTGYREQIHFGNNEKGVFFNWCENGVWTINNLLQRRHHATNIDFNTLVTDGIFECQGINLNTPYGSENDTHFWIQVYNHRPYYWSRQIAFDVRSENFYTRSCINGSWTAWKKVWIQGDSITGAVWNDYAEYRKTNELNIIPGNCIIENGDGTLKLSTERLQPGGNIISDTFGFAIGETEQCKTPLAVAGRVLAYPYENRETYFPGDAVCTGPNGTVSKMTREEIREWPDRIVGTVSEVPEYENWGTGNVAVNGRIWIKVK